MKETIYKSLYSFCLLVFLISVSFSLPLTAQIAHGYTTGTWYQFKTAAVSYTFDDNCANQLLVAKPLFDRYNFKATLFTVTNWNPNWTKLREASLEGFEVASHTVSHPRLTTLSIADQEYQLQQSQAVINGHIINTKCLTIAYPYNAVGDRATIEKYYIAGRVGGGVIAKFQEYIPGSVEFKDNFSVMISPNPFSNGFRIETAGTFCYSLHSLNGSLIKKGTGMNNEYIAGHLPSGIYILSIQTSNELYTRKIVKM